MAPAVRGRCSLLYGFCLQLLGQAMSLSRQDPTRHQNRVHLAMQVGTIGHVDHGKTTLTAALCKVSCFALRCTACSGCASPMGPVTQWRAQEAAACWQPDPVALPSWHAPFRSWPRLAWPRRWPSMRLTRRPRRRPAASPSPRRTVRLPGPDERHSARRRLPGRARLVAACRHCLTRQ